MSYAQEHETIVKEIIYGRKSGMALTMLVISPIGKPNGKAILTIVSGGWYSSRQEATNISAFSQTYVNNGYSAFCNNS